MSHYFRGIISPAVIALFLIFRLLPINEICCRFIICLKISSTEYDVTPQSSSRAFPNVVNPLKLGEIVKLKTGGKNCKLPSNEYFVKKVLTKVIAPDEPHGYTHFSFVPSLNKEFKQSAQSERPENTVYDYIYENQLGVSLCEPGWLELIEIRTPDGQSSTLDASDCGIATVLTQLCMVDPIINAASAKNEALKLFLTKADCRLSTEVLQKCVNFFGLNMVVGGPPDSDGGGPSTGAYAYFSAAKRSGYGIFFIYDEKESKYEEMPIDDANFGFIPTYPAKIINGDKTIDAHDTEWFFCNDPELNNQ